MTYKELIESTVPCKYIAKAKEQRELLPNEYYCLMVEDSRWGTESPHVRGVTPGGKYLVGVEKTSGENGWYISKEFNKRGTAGRGSTHVIEVLPENINKFRIL